MDRLFDINLLARQYLANTDAGLGEATGMVASQVWCCFRCGSQGKRLLHWDEASPPAFDTVDLGTCAGAAHEVVVFDWSISDNAQTSLRVCVWRGSQIHCQIHLQGRGLEGLQEVLYVLDGLASIAENARETLIGVVPSVDVRGSYSD